MKSLGRIIGRRSDASGFSLVELMIVVAIIGVLTAIAIPNFQAFQRRSRQSEAKAALTSIYTAEQTFHSSWEVYTGSLIPAGYTPSGEYRYQIGFDTSQAGFCGDGHGTRPIADGNMITCGPAPGREYTGVVDGSFGTGAEEWVQLSDVCGGSNGSETMGVRCNFNSTVEGKIKVGMTDNPNTSADESVVVNNGMGDVQTSVAVNTFLAGAIGDLLGQDDDMTYDTWTINQEKALVNVNNGLEF